MNAVTQQETTALATLPPAERAALALGAAAHEIVLRHLVLASSGIVSITNQDGREEAHRAGMVLLKTRTGIRATGKAARDDATKFSKAVIAKEDELIAIIEPEEVRVLALRDGWDAAEREAMAIKVAAERARIAAIASAIEGIRERGTDVAFIDKTSADTQATIDNLEAMPMSDTIYQERLAEAVELKASTLAQMRTVLADRIAAEAAEAQRLAGIATADKQRADEAAENARVAAENERVANELAAATRKLAEQQAAIELLNKQRADQAAANLKAEADARAEADRKAQAKLDAITAQIDAAQKKRDDDRDADDKRKADAAAQEKADDARDEATEMNLQFDMNANAMQALAAYASPAIADDLPSTLGGFVMLQALSDRNAIADAADQATASDLYPTDAELAGEICALFASEWSMDKDQAAARMATFDFAAALAVVA